MMLTIRSEQMAVFTLQFESRFARRMAGHLKETFPKEVARQGLSDERLELLALRGLSDARNYGVVNEGDVERYIECMVVLGPQFDTDGQFPWAGQALQNAALDGEAKMDRIDEHLVFNPRVGC
jgi:hypothetical protein